MRGAWRLASENEVRSHASLKGHTPLTFVGGHIVARAELNNVRWVSHCRTWSSSQWRPDNEFETDGVLADAVLGNGGVVTGVVPRQPAYQGLAHEGLSRLYVVDTMHERKHKMQSLAHACLALPGGFGTIEEIFEALTWAQQPLELHEKPCVFLNIDGYYDDLFKFLDHATDRGLLKATEPGAGPSGADRRIGATDDPGGLGRRRGRHAPDDPSPPAGEALTGRGVLHEDPLRVGRRGPHFS